MSPKPEHTKIKVILTIILVVVVLALSHDRSDTSVLLELHTDSISLTDPESDHINATILYQDITNIELLSTLSPGQCLSGTDSENQKYGLWSNDLYGTYQLFICPDIHYYIVLHTQQGITVFNYESKETTQQLYHALQEYIEKNH